MKIRLLVLLTSILAVTGCKQDFDVLSNYTEVPVIYGLLNATQDTNYIRIQKGYQIKGSAYLAAGVPDSIYYPDNLSVQISDGSQSFPLSRVVVNYDPANPLSKDSGGFAYSTNVLYRLDRSLDPNKNYSLKVINAESSDTFTASTGLVKDFNVGYPVYGAKLYLSNNNKSVIQWVASTNGEMYDLVIRFHYTEHYTNNASKDSFVDIVMVKSYHPSQPDVNLFFEPSTLFGSLATAIQDNPNVAYREFNFRKCMQFRFAAAGTDLSRYIDSRQAQSGLTSGEAIPPYSNINPLGDAVGIFSSRYFKTVDSVSLTNDARDSLACNGLMRKLKFRNRNNQLCN